MLLVLLFVVGQSLASAFVGVVPVWNKTDSTYGTSFENFQQNPQSFRPQASIIGGSTPAAMVAVIQREFNGAQSVAYTNVMEASNDTDQVLCGSRYYTVHHLEDRMALAAQDPCQLAPNMNYTWVITTDNQLTIGAVYNRLGFGSQETQLAYKRPVYAAGEFLVSKVYLRWNIRSSHYTNTIDRYWQSNGVMDFKKILLSKMSLVFAALDCSQSSRYLVSYTPATVTPIQVNAPYLDYICSHAMFSYISFVNWTRPGGAKENMCGNRRLEKCFPFGAARGAPFFPFPSNTQAPPPGTVQPPLPPTIPTPPTPPVSIDRVSSSTGSTGRARQDRGGDGSSGSGAPSTVAGTVGVSLFFTAAALAAIGGWVYRNHYLGQKSVTDPHPNLSLLGDREAPLGEFYKARIEPLGLDGDSTLQSPNSHGVSERYDRLDNPVSDFDSATTAAAAAVAAAAAASSSGSHVPPATALLLAKPAGVPASDEVTEDDLTEDEASKSVASLSAMTAAISLSTADDDTESTGSSIAHFQVHD